MFRLIRILALAAVLLARSAGAQTCQPEWLPEFGGIPGVDGTVSAMAVFDAGSGPEVYVGGTFAIAAGVPAANIAKWDGAKWSPVGSGVDGKVRAMLVYDDGSGPALFVGGGFQHAGAVSAPSIAKWNGASWAAVGSGLSLVNPLPSGEAPAVHALRAFDDGSGSKLYAAGAFDSSGSAVLDRVARWDGVAWSSFGLSVASPNVLFVDQLEVYDSGNGPALYVGGNFSDPLGTFFTAIARWDGSSWFLFTPPAVPTGLQSCGALCVASFGTGPVLLAGWRGLPSGLYVYDGSFWQPFAPEADIHALLYFDDGSGPAIYVGGSTGLGPGGLLEHGIAKWTVSGWSVPDAGIAPWTALQGVTSLLGVSDAGGGAVYAGGSFTGFGATAARGVAKLQGSKWHALGGGLAGYPLASAMFDSGSGAELYLGGSFSGAGDAQSRAIVKWNGVQWSAIQGSQMWIANTLAVHDDGTGKALYAAGIGLSGSAPTDAIARWNGAAWSSLPVPIAYSSTVTRLLSFDDGGGAELYACGSLKIGAGALANRVVKWDGATWTDVGPTFNSVPETLCSFDAGGGPGLYVGGAFTQIGGVTMRGVAKWNGSAWGALGTGLAGGPVITLAVHDDGGGPALYAGGAFTNSGPTALSRVAKWSGATWQPVGAGIGSAGSAVRALASLDAGNGQALYATGGFATAGGQPAKCIASWSGSSWAPLGVGLESQGTCLFAFDNGTGPALGVGGEFAAAPSGDSYLAAYACKAGVIASLPGCGGNPATLASSATSAPLGAVLPVTVSGGLAQTGVALVYFGAPATDVLGCGLVLPGLGEVLLAPTPAPYRMKLGALIGGSAALGLAIPNLPGLAGQLAHLQGVAVDAALPQPIELSNALAVKLGP